MNSWNKKDYKVRYNKTQDDTDKETDNQSLEGPSDNNRSHEAHSNLHNIGKSLFVLCNLM